MTALYPRQPAPLAFEVADDHLYGTKGAAMALALLQSGNPDLSRLVLSTYLTNEDRSWCAVEWWALLHGRNLLPRRLDEIALVDLLARIWPHDVKPPDDVAATLEAHQVAAAIIVGLRNGASDSAAELWATLSLADRQGVTGATLNIVASEE